MIFFDLDNMYPNSFIKKKHYEKFRKRKTGISILC